MKITVQRYCKNNTQNPKNNITYEIPLKNPTLLEALEYIKKNIDPTLSFDSGCRSEVCGSCGVVVNQKEVLACGYKIKENDKIEPLKHLPIIKDLIVEANSSFMALVKTRAYLEKEKEVAQNEDDEKKIEKQSDCILCNCCFSACPVADVNKDFLPPFIFSRIFRYISDKRCQEEKTKIEALQTNGIWDCTLCGECTNVCPQNLDPKMDVLFLRTKSTNLGYNNFQSYFNFDQNLTF